jgi:hypothetical protein
MNAWAKFYDDASQVFYYYNSKTGESSYERPGAFQTPRDGQLAVDQGANGWAKFVDDASGADYYFNAGTGESSYTRPVSFSTPRAGQAVAEQGTGGWAKFADDASGRCALFACVHMHAPVQCC